MARQKKESEIEKNRKQGNAHKKLEIDKRNAHREEILKKRK